MRDTQGKAALKPSLATMEAVVRDCCRLLTPSGLMLFEKIESRF